MHPLKQYAEAVPFPHCITCGTLQGTIPLQHARTPVANTVLCTHATNKKSEITDQADTLPSQGYHVHNTTCVAMVCHALATVAKAQCATSCTMPKRSQCLLYIPKKSLLLSQLHLIKSCNQLNIMSG